MQHNPGGVEHNRNAARSYAEMLKFCRKHVLLNSKRARDKRQRASVVLSQVEAWLFERDSEQALALLPAASEGMPKLGIQTGTAGKKP
jgi:hypothetical protein